MNHSALNFRPLFRLALTLLLTTIALSLVMPFAHADPRPSPAPDSARPWSAGRLTLDAGELLGKIDPALRKRLLLARPDERIPIIVEMREQADVERLSGEAAQADRAEAVVSALQATAARSQIGVRAFLAAEMIAGRAGHIRPFWIFNGLSAHLSAEDVPALAARDDVALVREDRYRQWVSRIVSSPGETQVVRRRSGQLPGVEWGIARIRADEVWAALNISGTGVVVANLDTGVDWQHPALQAAYRGFDKGLLHHAGNWYDATDAHAAYPIDPHGHGTHTMGTLVGGGGIGVAPGAKWIAVRVLSADGFGYDSWIHAGFQWALAPNGNPALAPDILNNSWGNDSGGDTTFQSDLRALRGAGIFAVFSNGNKGPGVGTVGSPASLPEAFAVGALDRDDDVASFSSRGPSPWGEIRPHVSAPGVGVRSSIPGGYATASGTSMAAPHVAGAVALMLSAVPTLTISDTASILIDTARPLTTATPNNDSGYGRLDAYAAVQAAANLGAISGRLTRAGTAAPIAGGRVEAISSAGLSASAATDADGRYRRDLASSLYTVTASAFGYFTTTQPGVVVITGATTPLDFQLAPVPAGILRGSLTEAESGRSLSGTILVENTPVTAPVDGVYSLALPEGTYALRAIALAHRVLTASVTITAGEIATQDFALPPAPTILLVDSGAWYDGSQIGYYRAALDELGYTYDSYRVKRLPADAPMSSTLAPYDMVVWSAPLDSPGLIGSGDAISAYLSSGGQLFLSGQDVGYWDGGLSFSWADYYTARLKALVEQDDAGPRWLDGAGIFDGIHVSLSDTHAANNQSFPDAIHSADPDFTADAFTYSNGLLGAQSVGLCLPYRAAYLAFGFEAIGAADQRREVMSRTLAYFDSPRNAGGATLSAPEGVLIGPPGSSVTKGITLRNIAETGSRDTFTLTAQSPPGAWPLALSSSSLTLDPCASGVVSVTVSIPPGTPINTSQAITVTAQSTVSPALTVSKRFVVKSPAVALLVDDDRWYEVEGAYQSALGANGISFDRWNVPKSWAGPEPGTPSPEQLGWYPFVVWFTGYDWYQPLTANNEATLTRYLDAGGRVMISAQDYLAVSGLSDFSRSQLGILDHGEDMSTTLARGVSGGPFDGIGPLTLVYTYSNFSDALAPYPTATVALVGRHGRPIALTRDVGAGKAMFLSFPFETIQAAEQAGVMERIVGYLSWLGESSVRASDSVAAPGADLDLEIVIHNDGPRGLASAAFSVSLPPGVSLRSGSTSWSGRLSAGQTLTTALVVQLDGSLLPGSIVAIPVAFMDNDHRAITFHKAARVGVGRPDLSSSSISVASNPARSGSQVTWTLVARNTGLADAPSAIITGLLPFNARLVSGTLTSGAGSASELSGTVKWTGSVPVNSLITLTYRTTVPGALADRLRFGSALFDDGTVLSHAADWLAAQPQRVYLPQVYKASP